jgi:3-isopropylmalate dehydrogenase
MTEFQVGVMYGDCIGPEVMGATLPVLDEIAKQAGLTLDYVRIPVAGEAYDLTGTHLPDSSLEAARSVDAVLKGPFGGPLNSQDPKWKGLEVNTILPLRKELDVYANLRPVSGRFAKLFTHLSPLKRFTQDVDMLFVRELTGDAYFGKKDSGIDERGKRFAYETIYYDEDQVRRIALVGCQQALQRGQSLTLVHKTNVLTETGALFKDITDEVAETTGVKTDYMHVDAMAAVLVRKPESVGTIVTSNLFGDILTDEASEFLGSIGLGGSASLGQGSFGLYEPIHGSSPDIAGTGKANPVGMMLSGAMLLRHSLGRPDEATAVEQAIGSTLDQGFLTNDLYSLTTPQQRHELALREVSTMEFSGQVVEQLRQAA